MKKLFLSASAALTAFSGLTFMSEAEKITNYSDQSIFNADVIDAFTGDGGFDTISFTQADYENAIGLFNARTDERVQIEVICKAFLSSSKAYVRCPGLYCNTAFVSDLNIDDRKIQYRLSEYDYLIALYNSLGWEITEDNLVFDDFKTEVDGNNAVAEVVESYTYYITDGFDDESFRRRKYTFTLNKEAGIWRIADVITDDPNETCGFTYEPINVSKAVKEACCFDDLFEKEVFNESVETIEMDVTRSNLYTWTYYSADAIDYAEKHYADGFNNAIFAYFPDGNCQNFASQCVWVGLGGDYSNDQSTDLPAVSTSRVGTNAANVWCCGQYSTRYSNHSYNWAWDNVKGFAKLIGINNPAGMEGPSGVMSYTNAIKNAEKGNVLYYSDGVASLDSLAHAMFITDTSGTAGARTKSNIKIAANTSQTNSAYQTLSSYAGSKADNTFAKASIRCGYYSVKR